MCTFARNDFLRKRCYQKVAGHVWFGYLPRYGALCRHARPPFTFSTLWLLLPPSHPLLHPLFLLPHEYIKVHAFLPNITCVHEQTDPSLSLFAASPHFYGTPSCALRAGNGNPPGFPLLFSLFLFWSLFILSFCPFQYIYIFFLRFFN